METTYTGRDCQEQQPPHDRPVAPTAETEEALVALFQHSRINIRYHAKRQKWFQHWHYKAVAFSAILGTSSFALVLGDFKILSPFLGNLHPALFTTAIAAIMSTLDLVIQFDAKAELHKSLKCRYLNLLTKINSANLPLIDLENETFLIEKDEPTTLKGLNAICHNEQCKAVGDKEGLCDIPCYVRFLKNYCSFDWKDFN